MVLYNCKRCGWKTKIKTHYKNHLNRKKMCKPILNYISIETLKNELISNTLKIRSNTLKYAEKEKNITKHTLKYAENTLKYAENTLKYAENTPKYAENTLKYAEDIKNKKFDSQGEIKCSNCFRHFKKRRYLTQHINRGNCKGFVKSDNKYNDLNDDPYYDKYDNKLEYYNDSQHNSIINVNQTNDMIDNNKNDNNNQNDILKLIIEQHEKEKIEWKKERDIMRTEISKLVEKVGTTYNSYNQQNIYINNLGQENLDYLSSDYLGKLLNLPYSAIPKLIKNIHFNPKHPENHNVRITNKKLPYAQIYKNNEWVISDKKEVIENMVDNGFNIIDSFYNEKSDNLDNNKKYKFKNFQVKYDDKEKNLLKKLNKDAELILINNSK